MLNPGQVRPHLQVLTDFQIEKIHKYSTQILERIGVRVDSPQAREILAASSGVSLEKNQVHISADLVDWALSKVSSTIDIFDSLGNPAFKLGDGQVRFGVGVTNLFYQDPETERLSDFSRAHMALGTRLAHTLPAFDLVSTIGIIKDAPEGTDDLYGVLEMAANTTKPLVLLNSDPTQFEASLDLLEYLRGNLAEKPSVIPYFNPVTPLIINRETGDKIIISIQRGLPIIFSNYGMAGTTTPISAAGTLATLNAELLAGLVLSQLVRQGAPIILGSLPAYFDMKTMSDFYDPHTILLNAACAEMMHHYHIPHAGTSGSGLGWSADIPGTGLLWLNHMVSSLGQTGLVPFVGGTLGSKAFSPALVVLANDVIMQMKYFASGFTLDDSTVNLEEIVSTGAGGNYLMAKTTRQNFRNAYFNSSLFPRLTLEKWEQKGYPDSSTLLKQETIRLLKETKPAPGYEKILDAGERFIQNFIATKH
jgi:trimethylamine--corrinoid protein Co-methyltransferase